MKTKESYPYIRAWGRMLHSHQYYITEQVEKARSENAPVNAIYRRKGGGWATFDEVTREDTRRMVSQLMEDVT